MMQRAKLFVKLKYSEGSKSMSLKDKVRAVKFKRQSNVMINEQSLPTKSMLIKIAKEELFVDYR